MVSNRYVIRTVVIFFCCFPLIHASGQQPPQRATSGTVHADIRSVLAAAPLKLQFRGKTRSEFQLWRSEFLAELQTMLGSSEPPVEYRVSVKERVVFADHERIELDLISVGLPVLPMYLLVPSGLQKGEKRPAVLAVHGHGEFGADAVVGRTDRDGIERAIASANYDYGLQFVRRGYVVAAPHLVPFGPRVERGAYRGNDPCAVTFVRMQALGRLPITENLRDLRWCLSFLQSRTEVDPLRLGCAGLSYGGRMTMLVSAVDERIRVAAVSGAMNLMQERFSGRHSCGSQMIPGLLLQGDYSEVGSLIAPRPCVWETGSKDSLIVPGWEDRFRERLERAYTAADAEANLNYDRFDGGHRWNGAVAFPLFDEVLQHTPTP